MDDKNIEAREAIESRLEELEAIRNAKRSMDELMRSGKCDDETMHKVTENCAIASEAYGYYVAMIGSLPVKERKQFRKEWEEVEGLTRYIFNLRSGIVGPQGRCKCEVAGAFTTCLKET
jgi:hypothetical protein